MKIRSPFRCFLRFLSKRKRKPVLFAKKTGYFLVFIQFYLHNFYVQRVHGWGVLEKT